MEDTVGRVAGEAGTGCAWLVGVGWRLRSVIVTGSANRTCCVSVVCRTGDCWVGGGVGGSVADVDVGCDVEEDSVVGSCSATGFGAAFAGGGASGTGGPVGRRRGGAFGAAFLPDVAELISVDMVSPVRQH